MKRYIAALVGLLVLVVCLAGCEVDADDDLDIRLADESQPVVSPDSGRLQQVEVTVERR